MSLFFIIHGWIFYEHISCEIYIYKSQYYMLWIKFQQGRGIDSALCESATICYRITRRYFMIYKVCPGYIDVRQTVLVLLTMAGLFLDRPRISETRGVYDSG